MSIEKVGLSGEQVFKLQQFIDSHTNCFIGNEKDPKTILFGEKVRHHLHAQGDYSGHFATLTAIAVLSAIKKSQMTTSFNVTLKVADFTPREIINIIWDILNTFPKNN
ncbi:MAG: hypothetical protein NTX82_05285 [Candidatus Parcubacteria bacterium]|nr:hypothetical protein [Candidatus Parcubacteria bacterium]